MPNAETIESAQRDLLIASSALDCVLNMLDQMPSGASITAAGLVALLQPVFCSVSTALECVSDA